VINSAGQISRRDAPTAHLRQAEVLRGEGIEIVEGPLGELKVSLATYGWFPSVLPSEEGSGSNDEEEAQLFEKD
jgi:methylated-DNA-protein-cysteine methyltransferase-like protein